MAIIPGSDVFTFSGYAQEYALLKLVVEDGLSFEDMPALIQTLLMDVNSIILYESNNRDSLDWSLHRDTIDCYIDQVEWIIEIIDRKTFAFEMIYLQKLQDGLRSLSNTIDI